VISTKHAPLPQQKITERKLSPGVRGTAETVAAMRTLIIQGARDPEMREYARQLMLLNPSVAGVGREREQAERILRHAQDIIGRNYLRDPRGVERVQSAKQSIFLKAGDCDDGTVLFCTLCETIGLPTRIVTVGYEGRRGFNHVFPQVNLKSGWVSAETVLPGQPIGWEVPHARRRVWHVYSPMDSLGELGFGRRLRRGLRRVGRGVRRVGRVGLKFGQFGAFAIPGAGQAALGAKFARLAAKGGRIGRIAKRGRKVARVAGRARRGFNRFQDARGQFEQARGMFRRPSPSFDDGLSGVCCLAGATDGKIRVRVKRRAL
jgi:hypothetical protein